MLKWISSLLFMVVSFCAFAKQTICLNMIVKNESRVIQRCLDSVLPIIDYWVIVDTGSRDGTQKIIKKHLKGIPGKLYERPWKNFGENRSEAFELAKGKADYILFMDADDILKFEGKAELPLLTQDLYHMWRGSEGFSYLKPQIVKASLPWKWVGVTHEYLDNPNPYTLETLKNVKYVSCDGGASSYDPKKFLRNVALLEDGLKKEPENARYAFYLAESYRDSGQKGKAIECYQKRVNMGGWQEEVFWSLFQIATLMNDIGLPSNVVIQALENAHNYRAHRPEPLYHLADLYNKIGEYEKAYKCIKDREKLKLEYKDSLFNVDWMDEYGFLFQLSICSYYVGNYQESLEACDKLLAMERLPTYWVELTKTNRTYPLQKLQIAEKKDDKTPTASAV